MREEEECDEGFDDSCNLSCCHVFVCSAPAAAELSRTSLTVTSAISMTGRLADRDSGCEDMDEEEEEARRETLLQVNHEA